MQYVYQVHVIIPDDFQGIVDNVTARYASQKITPDLLLKVREEIHNQVQANITIQVDQREMY